MRGFADLREVIVVLNVFISYSWSNSIERDALISGLSNNNAIKLLVDKNYVKYGDSIHERISRMIDDAHCIVVLLTKNGAKSVEVREELARCHERGKKIIPIVSEGTDLSFLPSHLRDTNYIEYKADKFDLVINELKIALNELATSLQNDIENEANPTKINLNDYFISSERICFF